MHKDLKLDAEVAQSNPLYKTTNYKQFKRLKGNRPIEQSHVQFFVRKMEKEGNLTQIFPMQINENHEILDGQHRLLACEIRKEPIYFEIKEYLNIDTVISGNTGNRNWTWLDFANSWAERGNIDYQTFLKLHEDFPHQKFNVLFQYATLGNGKRTGGGIKSSGDNYNHGEMKLPDPSLSRLLLKQLEELEMVTAVHSRDFALAAYRFMRTPTYEHDKMLQQLNAYGSALINVYTLNDFLYTLEEIWRR